jgi:hypothetical protein
LEKFEVEWGGWVLTSDSTLTLRRDEISLVSMADEEVDLSYEQVEVKETDGREIVLEAPINFERDSENKENHNLTFPTRGDAEKAVETIESSKTENRSEGDSEEGSAEKSLGGDSSQRIGSTESKDEPSTRLQSEPENDESDGRYWYNKKRWAIPFFWALVPAILWNGYEKYLSGRNEQEWLERYVPLFLQLTWFPPVGWYGLYQNESLTGGKSLLAGILSPVLFLFTLFVFYYPIALENASEFENKRKKILKSLSESDSLEKNIDRAEKYSSALSFLGRNDERLSSTLDSLRDTKRSRYINEKIEKIKSKESFESSLKAADRYERNGKYVNKKFLKFLDSLRARKTKGMINKINYLTMRSLSEKLEVAKNALKLADKFRFDRKNLVRRIEKKIKKIRRYKKEGKCIDISGRYTGRCRVFLNELKILPGDLFIRDKCGYNLDVTTGIPLEGTIKHKDKKNEYGMSGRTLKIYDNKATLQYEVGRYTASCTLYK